MNNYNYGFIFNDINILDGKFIKKSKNNYGKLKINNEIEFYNFIKSNNILFNMPKLIKYSDGELVIEYIDNTINLSQIINKTNIEYYLNEIKNKLNSLHDNKIYITKDTLNYDIYLETELKILNRFNEYNWKSNLVYNTIEYVNEIKIKDINYYCKLIHNKLWSYLQNRNYYNLIHGDIHLGNILLDEKDNKLYFIDPRGYFGNTKLFGLLEYDYAKLLFGLSGYSYFDNLKIENLEIMNGNLKIDFINNYEYVFVNNKFDNITNLLCLSIWLANNSCFIDINKKITSLMIALYYCEKYIDKF